MTIGRRRGEACASARAHRRIAPVPIGVRTPRSITSESTSPASRPLSRTAVSTVTGRNGRIVLKNSHFRIDRNCRGQGRAPRNFGWGHPAYEIDRLLATFLNAPRWDSCSNAAIETPESLFNVRPFWGFFNAIGAKRPKANVNSG